MKNIKKFFSYFFQNEARFCTLLGFILLIIFEIIKNGFSSSLSFVFEIFIAFLAVAFMSTIEIILYIIWKYIWYQNTDDEPFLVEDIVKKDLVMGIIFANICAILYLIYKGSILWK